MHLHRPGTLTPARLSLVLFGMVMAATAVLMIKAAGLPPALLAACRLAGAAAVLAPLWYREVQRDPVPWSWRQALPSVVPGVFLGLHFIAWNAGARATLAGNATLVVNLSPLVMPFFAWFVLKEAPSRREWVGTGLALVGLGILAWGDYHFSPEHLAGDGLCLTAMVLYVVYIVLARRRSRPGALFSYLVPLYASGAVVCLGWALAFERPFPPVTPTDLLLVAGLVLGPTIAGHSINNWAMTVARAQTLSLINLGQFVLAGLMAFAAFGELPGPYFGATAALVVAGALVALIRTKPSGA